MVLLVICVLAGVTFAVVTLTMFFVGLVSMFPSKLGPRHRGCGHPRVITGPHPEVDRCWWCRHSWLTHAIEAPVHLLHLSH